MTAILPKPLFQKVTEEPPVLNTETPVFPEKATFASV